MSGPALTTPLDYAALSSAIGVAVIKKNRKLVGAGGTRPLIYGDGLRKLLEWPKWVRRVRTEARASARRIQNYRADCTLRVVADVDLVAAAEHSRGVARHLMARCLRWLWRSPETVDLKLI